MPQNTKGGGWVLLAGSLIVILGALDVVMGLIALLDEAGFQSMMLREPMFSIGAWAWVHMILGVALVFVGLGILSNKPLAKGIGIGLAGLTIVEQFVNANSHPWWSLIVILMAIAVIHALAMYDSDPVA